MASNVAIISDIRGLVTQGDNAEEILKDRDPISENGGLLTISEFAKIVFDDGREIVIEGPTQIRLDSSFFENAAFIPEETTVNFETLPLLRTLALDEPVLDAPEGGLNPQNDERGGVIIEQLDTARNEEQPRAIEQDARAQDTTTTQTFEPKAPEGVVS